MLLSSGLRNIDSVVVVLIPFDEVAFARTHVGNFQATCYGLPDEIGFSLS
jgi:hypothetical protein